ncbi:MAG: hypothetical protein ILP18_01040 [Treponema sp.]|nr:hypothetical protein [Treponema sp.]
MNTIGKSLLLSLFLVGSSLPATAFEAGTQFILSGGAAGNGGGRYSTYERYDTVWGNLDILLQPGWWSAHQVTNAKLIGWFDMPFVEDSTFGLAGQASLKYSQENSYDEVPMINLIPDIDLLRYYYNKVDARGGFTLSAGRFNVSDKTGDIINQKIDGLYLGYGSNKVQFGVYGGYTGLLNSRTTMMINSTGMNFWTSQLTDSLYSTYVNKVKPINTKSLSDLMNKVDWGDVMSDVGRSFYIWADPYFVSAANLTFPYLFANQTAYLEASLAISTEGPSKVEDEFDRFYITGGLYGPLIFSDLIYSFSTTFSTYGDSDNNKSAFEGLANFSKLKLTYFTNFHNLALSAELKYASGDNGIYDPFYGLTSNPISYMRYSPEHNSAVKYGISASFKPTKEFLVTIGTDQLFSYKKNIVDYQGWQIYSEMKLQCTSDFQFQVKAYRFLATDSTYDNTGATITGVFSF